MKVNVAKWGNSLAVRIPKACADEIGLKEGMPLEIAADSDTILLRRPRFLLQEMVAGVSASNRHTPTEWGAPVGQEAW